MCLIFCRKKSYSLVRHVICFVMESVIRLGGVASRPRVIVDGVLYWVADNEFDCAPEDPGTYEGDHGKPHVESGYNMNKWCARSCERSKILGKNEEVSKSKLTDFSKRICIE